MRLCRQIEHLDERFNLTAKSNQIKSTHLINDLRGERNTDLVHSNQPRVAHVCGDANACFCARHRFYSVRISDTRIIVLRNFAFFSLSFEKNSFVDTTHCIVP